MLGDIMFINSPDGSLLKLQFIICLVKVVLLQLPKTDSGEIFVRVRNFEQMKRLGSITMFVGGDSVIFTHVDRLNAICQPSDISSLGEMSYFRH